MARTSMPVAITPGMPNHIAHHDRLHQRINDLWLDPCDADYGAVGNGVANDTAAMTACVAGLPTTGGTIGMGTSEKTYLLTATMDFGGSAGVQRNNRHIRGEGATLHFTGTYVNGARMVNTSNSSWVGVNVTAPSTVTNGLTITTSPNSTEQFPLERVVFQGQAQNGIAIGPDTAGDVSEVMVSHVFSGGTVSGFLVGNGTSGNVIDIHFSHCVSRGAQYGLKADGAGFTWTSGTTLGNTIADFYYATPGGAPVYISGVRSEGSAKFWKAAGTSTYGGTSVTLLNCVCVAFTDAGGVVIDHGSAIPLTMIGGAYYGGPVVAVFNLGFDPANPLVFTAIGVATDNSGNPYKTNTTANGFEATFVIRTIISPVFINGSTEAVPVEIGNVKRATLYKADTGTLGTTPDFDAKLADEIQFTLNANVTASGIINPKVGQRLTISVVNDNGSRTMVWPGNVRWASDVVLVQAAAGRESSVDLVYDGSLWKERARATNVSRAP